MQGGFWATDDPLEDPAPRRPWWRGWDVGWGWKWTRPEPRATPAPPRPRAPLGLLLPALHVFLQSAELLLRVFQLRPQGLIGQPQLGVLRLRLQLLSGAGLQLLFQLGRGRQSS